MKISLNNKEKMEAFSASFIAEVIGKERNKSGATILGLRGDLGAGKTTFTKGVAKALGVEGVVTSPTFVIEKIYKLPTQTRPKGSLSGRMAQLGGSKGVGFSRLIHIDAYRLDSGNELLRIGWNDIVSDKENLILMEWPEKVADILPKDMTTVQFKFVDENTREVEY